MPRRSAAYLTLGSFVAGPTRLQPPIHLSAAEHAVWLEIVSTTPPEHFKPEDTHLLEAYCSAVVQRRQAAAEITKASRRYDRVAKHLADRLRAAGLSIYEPDPVNALQEIALKNQRSLHLVEPPSAA